MERSVMKNLLVVLLLALSGAACATAGTTAGTTANSTKVDRVKLADGSVLVCEMELPTGSHIRERVCRTEEGTTASEKEATRAILNKPLVQMAK
jgi:hypothetical protein